MGTEPPFPYPVTLRQSGSRSGFSTPGFCHSLCSSYLNQASEKEQTWTQSRFGVNLSLNAVRGEYLTSSGMVGDAIWKGKSQVWLLSHFFPMYRCAALPIYGLQLVSLLKVAQGENVFVPGVGLKICEHNYGIIWMEWVNSMDQVITWMFVCTIHDLMFTAHARVDSPPCGRPPWFVKWVENWGCESCWYPLQQDKVLTLIWFSHRSQTWHTLLRYYLGKTKIKVKYNASKNVMVVSEQMTIINLLRFIVWSQRVTCPKSSK